MPQSDNPTEFTDCPEGEFTAPTGQTGAGRNHALPLTVGYDSPDASSGTMNTAGWHPVEHALRT